MEPLLSFSAQSDKSKSGRKHPLSSQVRWFNWRLASFFFRLAAI